MPFSRVAALAGLAVLSSTASAFPIANLPVSNDTFSQLSNQSLPQAERDALATAQVLPQLRLFFNQTTHAIEIETSDVAIQQSIPDSTIDDSCDHKVTSEGATAKGNVLNDTELSFGISNISWTGGVQVQYCLISVAQVPSHEYTRAPPPLIETLIDFLDYLGIVRLRLGFCRCSLGFSA